MQDFVISVEPHLVKNFWSGRGNQHPVAIVEHIMQGNIDTTLRYFNGEIGKYPVSAHYGVARDGRIWQFVLEEDTAWSNGVIQQPDSALGWVSKAQEQGLNLNTLTISIQYEGKSGEPFTEAQYEAAVALHRRIIEKWGIPADTTHIVGQHQLDSVNRAANPGTAFPWSRLLQDLNRSEPRFHTESVFEAPQEADQDVLPKNSLGEEIQITQEKVDLVDIDHMEALEQGTPLMLNIDRDIATFGEPEPEKQSGTNIVWTALGGGVVSVELANLRERPSLEPGTILRTASRGTRLHFDGYALGPELMNSTYWLHISRDDGYGWIHTALVQLDKAFPFPY
jgi:N-acetyl-anhydromuramyl-L-alanine amidase AmpD